MVGRHGQASRSYTVVRDMFERYPLAAIAPGRDGNTLMHNAIRQEDLEVGARELGWERLV